MKRYEDEELHIGIDAERYQDEDDDYRNWQETCALEYAEWCLKVDKDFLYKVKGKDL